MKNGIDHEIGDEDGDDEMLDNDNKLKSYDGLNHCNDRW